MTTASRTDHVDAAERAATRLFFTPEGRADPYPLYHELRAASPVHRTAQGMWLLTRYDDCWAVLRDPRLGKDYARQIEQRFGWFLAAYRYGAPPHRGFGQGLDRLVMSLLGVDNIREVIAFPKTATAQDPLTGAPAPIEEEQWRELGLRPRT